MLWLPRKRRLTYRGTTPGWQIILVRRSSEYVCGQIVEVPNPVAQRTHVWIFWITKCAIKLIQHLQQTNLEHTAIMGLFGYGKG